MLTYLLFPRLELIAAVEAGDEDLLTAEVAGYQSDRAGHRGADHALADARIGHFLIPVLFSAVHSLLVRKPFKLQLMNQTVF